MDTLELGGVENSLIVSAAQLMLIHPTCLDLCKRTTNKSLLAPVSTHRKISTFVKAEIKRLLFKGIIEPSSLLSELNC